MRIRTVFAGGLVLGLVSAGCGQRIAPESGRPTAVDGGSSTSDLDAAGDQAADDHAVVRFRLWNPGKTATAVTSAQGPGYTQQDVDGGEVTLYPPVREGRQCPHCPGLYDPSREIDGPQVPAGGFIEWTWDGRFSRWVADAGTTGCGYEPGCIENDQAGPGHYRLALERIDWIGCDPDRPCQQHAVIGGYQSVDFDLPAPDPIDVVLTW